jgi:hypothetical protein
VNALANKRAELLAGGGWQPRKPYDDLDGGRLLLFDPDSSTSDGTAARESNGFFDGDNLPAWDTWVWYAEDSNSEAGWKSFGSYLIAWVPPHVVDLAEMGMQVNPEMCIQWASDVDTALTRRLRTGCLLR